MLLRAWILWRDPGIGDGGGGDVIGENGVGEVLELNVLAYLSSQYFWQCQIDKKCWFCLVLWKKLLLHFCQLYPVDITNINIRSTAIATLASTIVQ